MGIASTWMTLQSTKPEPEPRLMSRIGATETAQTARSAAARQALSISSRLSGSAPARAQAVADDFFLPDFCHPRMVLAVVLLSELLAVVFSLARPHSAGAFLTDLARLSLFVQWLGLTSAGM